MKFAGLMLVAFAALSLPLLSKAQQITTEGVVVTNLFRGTEMCLDITASKDTKLMSCYEDDDESQIWYYKEIGEWLTIHTMSLGDDYCLDVRTNVQGRSKFNTRMQKCKEIDTQLWTLERLGQGAYNVKNKKYFQNKCLDTHNGGTDNNKTQIRNCGRYSGQYWRFSIM